MRPQRDLGNILVIDVESSCWQEKTPPRGQESEIIEIGVALLRANSDSAIESESIIIKPVKSTISDFCTKLTTITQADVDKGVSLNEACNRLKDWWRSEYRTWASYGDYDRVQFERCCRSAGIRYPFGRTHMNVKNLFAHQRLLDKEVGMSEALEIMELPLEGTHHRGIDDAKNIAKILARVLWPSLDAKR